MHSSFIKLSKLFTELEYYVHDELALVSPREGSYPRHHVKVQARRLGPSSLLVIQHKPYQILPSPSVPR